MSDVLTWAASGLAFFLLLTFVAWRRYLWACVPSDRVDTCPYSLTDYFSQSDLLRVSHQQGIRWLSEVFSRSANKYPHLPALQIPHTGESLSFAQLDARVDKIVAALAPFLSGPDQVVAVAMLQDNADIVASHLAILRAGGAMMILDTTLPDALVQHMLDDAHPVVVLTRGEKKFRDLPTLDVLNLPEPARAPDPPNWLDDPHVRLAAIFYTSGTTGKPKGVECPHAGYVNLALSYAAYFDLVPGMDATSLTSSLGYDGSISEMYSAWVAGCAVVLISKEQLRSGPDLLPVLRQAEVTVLFCPPVLLTTLTTNPELDLPYPLCRYIVPAGEAFPSALVEPWTRARRQIINTYGPTEASTDTSRQSLRPGEPVTIGSPFPNVTYVILEPGELQPVPHGEAGELCIGGVHVVRGYRNLPEQTAQKFIEHPRFGRLYRTGDRCRIDIQNQRVHFLGRIDAQLKVRGHRVEVQPIEDILQTQFSEIEAAVVDYQNDALIAFVAAPSLRQPQTAAVAPAPAEWANRVIATLTDQLPPPSVPGQIFTVEKFAMKAVSGKIDRERLPKLSATMTASGLQPEHVAAGAREAAKDLQRAAAEHEMDPACKEALVICRGVFAMPLGLDDPFVESGGHSILIARLAQQLQAAGWQIPVRALLGDCNTARKVATRPRAVQQSCATTTLAKFDRIGAAQPHEAEAVLSVRRFTALQVMFAILLYSPALIGFVVALSTLEIGSFVTSASVWEFMFAAVVVYLIGLTAPFAALLWAMLIKLFLCGSMYKSNVRPGIYAKWSTTHLRIWCIGRTENTVLLTLRVTCRSAPLMAFVLRQLGASIGRNLHCAQDASLSGPLDLLSVGDDIAIQTGAYLHTTRWSGQYLCVGPIHLESGCKIGMRAAVGPDVKIGHGSWIPPFTAILSDVGAQEIWEGAPARRTGRCTELERIKDTCRLSTPIPLLEAGNLLIQVFASFWLVIAPTAAILWSATALFPGAEADISQEYFRTTPLSKIIGELALYAFITGWLTILVTSLLGCLFVRWSAFGTGLIPTHGLRAALLMYRMQVMNRVQGQWTWTLTGQYLRALAGMRFPRLGASECDVMFNLVPELASADSQVFWSNGCFTNMLDYGARHITLRQIDMPRDFFSGNNCVAEHGQFPSNFLLGASTPASDIQFRRQMRSRLGNPITVAGNPPVKFASASLETATEQERLPGFSLLLVRLFLFDLMGIGVLPITEALIFTIAYVCLLRLDSAHATAIAIIALLLTEVALILWSIGLKQWLVGRKWGMDHAAPFWSWRHFAYFFTQDCFFTWCRGSLGFFAGTLLANPVLRWMGCGIGRRTIVTQPMQCADWNAVRIGKDCVMDGILQLHSFENMMLKVKRSEIEDGCAVGFGSTVMGGAHIGRETTLLPLSLVLKEMSLPTAIYHGSPVEPINLDGQAHACPTSNA